MKKFESNYIIKDLNEECCIYIKNDMEKSKFIPDYKVKVFDELNTDDSLNDPYNPRNFVPFIY